MENKEIEEYIVGTQALLEKTAAVYATNAPIIADKLVALGLVKAAGKQAAINSLQSPELVLNTLNSLLDSSLAVQSKPAPSTLGGPVKLASTTVTGKVKKESDIIWENQFLK